MRKILICLVAALLPLTAAAEQHGTAEAEVRAAVVAYNGAYASNDVEGYFAYYVADATVYFYGARQDVATYHDEWVAMIEGGGGVETYDLSDVQVRMLAGGDAAIANYFVEYRIRNADESVSEGRAFETDIWQKIDGAWRVVGLHYSDIAGQQ